MFCKKCGRELKDGSKFCDYCGQRVESNASQAHTEESLGSKNDKAADNSKASAASWKKKTAAIVSCAMGVVVIAAVIVIGVLKSQDAKKEKAEKPEVAAGKLETSQNTTEDSAGDIVKEEKERPKEPADLEDSTPEPPLKEYSVDYRDAYRSILEQAVNSEQGASSYVVYDMDGDGMPEFLVMEGNSAAAFRWMAYSYDIESGTAYPLGEVATGSAAIYGPENGEAGIIAAQGYMGEEEVLFVKKAGKDGLDISTMIERHEAPGDYYSTPYPLGQDDVEYPMGLDLIQGEAMTVVTGLWTPEGKEVFRIPGEAFATSVLQEAGQKYSTSNLFDLNPSTVWVEGAEGAGAGEAITFATGVPYNADGIAILPGYCKDQEAYEANGRPLKITVKCGEKIVSEELKDFVPDFENPMNSMIYVDFGETVYADKYTVTVSKSVGGAKYEDMCISELFPYSYTQ